jgi:hypothetical protein
MALAVLQTLSLYGVRSLPMEDYEQLRASSTASLYITVGIADFFCNR